MNAESGEVEMIDVPNDEIKDTLSQGHYSDGGGADEGHASGQDKEDEDEEPPRPTAPIEYDPMDPW